MKILRRFLKGAGSKQKTGQAISWAVMRWGTVAGLGMLWMCSVRLMYGQGGQTANTIPKPQSYILPAANRPPDANDRMIMQESQLRRQDFDKVNAKRIQLIDDEAVKLLILARDLKAKMDKLGQGPLPPEMDREMEVIAILAHDVQEKMKLTVGGS